MKFEVKTNLGHNISANRFGIDNDPKAIIIIAPATGVKQSYYRHYAEFLEQQNYQVITFDYFGIGESKTQPIKTIKISATEWGKNDLTAVIEHAVKTYPDKKTVVIGHSMGGQLIGLSPSAPKIDKVVLVAAQSGYWRFWSGFGRFKMMFNWFILIPVMLRIFGYFPGRRLRIMEDLPGNVAWEWRNWGVSSNYLFDHLAQSKINFNLLKCKLFSYSIADDKYAPKNAVDWLTGKYESAEIFRRHLTPKKLGVSSIGHFGIFKPKFKNTIWEMMLEDIR